MTARYVLPEWSERCGRNVFGLSRRRASQSAKCHHDDHSCRDDAAPREKGQHLASRTALSAARKGPKASSFAPAAVSRAGAGRMPNATYGSSLGTDSARFVFSLTSFARNVSDFRPIVNRRASPHARDPRGSSSWNACHLLLVSHRVCLNARPARRARLLHEDHVDVLTADPHSARADHRTQHGDGLCRQVAGFLLHR